MASHCDVKRAVVQCASDVASHQPREAELEVPKTLCISLEKEQEMKKETVETPKAPQLAGSYTRIPIDLPLEKEKQANQEALVETSKAPQSELAVSCNKVTTDFCFRNDIPGRPNSSSLYV
jgi:hypothetical protein